LALPGVSVQIQDRFYALTRTDVPAGPRVCAIAKRSTASGTGGVQDLDAYVATSESDVITAFGENSNIHKAFVELISGGAPRVILVALPSDSVFNHTTAALTSAANPTIDVFTAAFEAAEAAQVDVIVPWGAGSNSTHWESPATPGNDGSFDYFYADNNATPSVSWAKKVSDMCATITARSAPTYAVMGLKPYIGVANADGSFTASALSTHLSFANLVDRESLESGHYLSVVASELRIVGVPSSWGFSNGACLYAGSIMRLDAWSATTGKVVYNSDRIRWNPTRTQAELIANKGLVPVMLDLNRIARWTDGTTFGKDASDYERLSTLRIVFDAVKLVRSVSQNYVGEAATIANRNSFETQLSSSLRGMQILGALISSDFRVTYIPAQNQAVVDLALRPAFELREVVIRISVNF
jgi:hypothetical protein